MNVIILDPWIIFAMSSLDSAVAFQMHMDDSVINVNQVTGTSPIANNATAMDMQMSASLLLELAQVVGTIQLDQLATGTPLQILGIFLFRLTFTNCFKI